MKKESKKKAIPVRRLPLPDDPPVMSYIVSIACLGTLEEFPTLAKAQAYINEEIECSGFDPDEVEVIKGYYLKTRDLKTVEVLDSPRRA